MLTNIHTRFVAARTACSSIRIAAACALFTATAALTGCTTDPKNFDSPESAVGSLVAALRSDSTAQLYEILGSDADKLLDSGDSVADANGRSEFLRLYDERNRLVKTESDVATLEIGSSAWPMPIPVVQGDKGWYFDTVAGLDEMLSRRIGRNELSAIQVCLAIDDAQREYAAADHDNDGWREYAQKFASDTGKKNGLYWPTSEGEPSSPLGEFVADAAEEGYGATKGQSGRRPYHGYYYKILTSQGPAAPGGELNFIANGHMIGGFAVIAWPAEYANSGLKSFMVSHHGIVYEKDLGDDTHRIAESMKSFNPGEGWAACASANSP